MSKVRLSDLLKSKNPGDEWFTLMAPEQCFRWNKSKPWDADLFSSKKVSLQGAHVSAFETPKKNRIKLSKKAPWILPNGMVVDSGYYQSATNKSAGFNLRADSVAEFTENMIALCDRTGFEIWNIDSLEIYNSEKGASIEYKVFNPDGHGAGLFLYRVHSDGGSKLYPDILLSRQEEVVADFYEVMARCTCVEGKEKFHSCALDKKVVSKQIKLRKKNT